MRTEQTFVCGSDDPRPRVRVERVRESVLFIVDGVSMAFYGLNGDIFLASLKAEIDSLEAEKA